jgi:hypothetical protein
MRRNTLASGPRPKKSWVAFLLAACALAAALVPPHAAARQFIAQESDFQCLLDWPKVRNFRIFNANPKRMKKALRIAERGRRGRRYPVGTIIQLVPFEAMVKRGRGFDRACGGWEFFRLDVSPQGTTIPEGGRGCRDVVSFGLSGANCQKCHSAARAFDFVCETGHGCKDLNLSAELVDRLQSGDPRCGSAP